MNLRFTVVGALLVASFSSCVTVEMPKHMVSDAVGAGKDIYRSVDRALRKTPKLGEVESNSDGSEFWLANAGSADASVAELERTCLETLVTQTRQRVGVEALEYKVIDRRVDARDDGVVVLCKIAVSPGT